MEIDKQASERAFLSHLLFSRARNHNHSFAGLPLHRAQSPESSSNGIKTRPISTPSRRHSLTNDTPMRRKRFYTQLIEMMAHPVWCFMLDNSTHGSEDVITLGCHRGHMSYIPPRTVRALLTPLLHFPPFWRPKFLTLAKR
ncbi:hypothetical protein FOXG_19467 [Fusarium oxysporum f. sp. lycopersici 4287]|uniref:Uncharacterized protein n=1 Tax=Fusarium oxysporum f. sp. lycopersici (strain 4287 / CBS 123668 / FGSC 9935 / NRRL 34936) TaxID=426428 RepID=A0A0J9V0W6_FUSO4|nr:hypothetical protein FOXG_19467 [Fusarium oxysporum f. sp. lycopersici 4287]KNB04960.1 hypothetical protein FOXG_19467 [Fusarium oxysporum f. sp. lycopersici 4287]